jgi:uncharacterized membrane protein
MSVALEITRSQICTVSMLMPRFMAAAGILSCLLSPFRLIYRTTVIVAVRMKDEPRKYTAPALEKGLDILELLSRAETGLSQSEIARDLGRSVSEIFRMLVVLEERGYIALEEADRYVLRPDFSRSRTGRR